MDVEVRVEAARSPLPAVAYRWDADTDILTATLGTAGPGDGMSGSVEIEGSDGSWLIFDVSAGQIASVEVAVWPEVRKLASLRPPGDAEPSRVTVPSRRSNPGVAALEVDTRLTAEADHAERTFHFRIGEARAARAVRLAKDLVLDIDERERVVGVWLLNVPPFPEGA